MGDSDSKRGFWEKAESGREAKEAARSRHWHGERQQKGDSGKLNIDYQEKHRVAWIVKEKGERQGDTD